MFMSEQGQTATPPLRYWFTVALRGASPLNPQTNPIKSDRICFKKQKHKELKMSKQLRTKSIKIRVTPQELKELKSKSDTKQLAVFMREVSLGIHVPRPRKEHPKIDPEFMRKFAGACNNLNQLTRLANIEKDNLQKLNIAYELQKIRAELERLKNDVS